MPGKETKMSDQQWGSHPPQQPPPRDTTPPPEWPPPPPPHHNPPRPPRQKRQFLVTKIAIGVAAGIVLFIIGVIVLIGVLIDGSTGGKQAATATPAATEQAAPAAYTPTPKDFKLTVKTLSKECFGSAGCNITFRIEVGYGGPDLDPSTTWEVTYEIRGAEDPQINTLTVQGDQSSVDQEEIASTKSSATKLKAVVTDVSEQ
jgi:hypothetical protein